MSREQILGFKDAASILVLLAETGLAYFTYTWGSLFAGGMVQSARLSEEPEPLAFWVVVAFALVQPVMSVFGPAVGWLAWALKDGERLIWGGFHLLYIPVPMLVATLLSPFT